MDIDRCYLNCSSIRFLICLEVFVYGPTLAISLLFSATNAKYFITRLALQVSTRALLCLDNWFFTFRTLFEFQADLGGI